MAFDSNLSGTTELDAHLITSYERMFIIEQENLSKGLDDLVTVKFQQDAKTFTFPKYGALTVQTAALTEDNDMTSESMSDSAITVTPAEYGNVSQTTNLVNRQSGGLPDMAAVRVHAKNMRESQEKKLILTGEAGSNEITVNATNEATTAAGDVLTAAFVKRARNKLARVGATNWGCIIHPDVLHDLMIETGTGAWTEIARYGTDARILHADIPAFAGITFRESNLVAVNTDAGNGTVDTYHTQFFGFNAFGKGVSQEPKMIIRDAGDKMGRFKNIGWYGVYEYTLVDTDYHWLITSSSSIGSN